MPPTPGEDAQEKPGGRGDATAKQEEDPRHCCASRVLDIMHRTFLLFPVREIPAALSHVCVPIRRSLCCCMEEGGAAATQTTTIDALLLSAMPATAYEPRFTWKARSSRLVTLLKRDHATTVIWDHASDTGFAAAPCVSLGPGCPVGTALLGQVVLDMVVSSSSSSSESASASPVASSRGSGGTNSSSSFDTPPAAQQHGSHQQQWIPSILVFDIIQLGDACNFSRARCPAMERYSVLLNLNHPSKGIFTSQHLKVQWAGKLHALVEFDAAHRDTMPHIMEDYIRLGDEDPLEILFLRRDSV